MRLTHLSILLALCALPLAARADDLVPGSNITFTIAQYDATASSYTTFTSWTLTPGGTTPFTLGAAVGTITETHTALAGGYDQFTFSITADSDLFPQYVPGEDYEGVIGIEGLQFNTPYTPTSALLTYSSPSGVIVLTDGTTANQDFVSSLSNPFDGNFVANGDPAGYDAIGGLDTNGIVLQLSNSPVPTSPNTPQTPIAATPEPSSLLLLATGLIGAAGAARRRFNAIE